MIAGPLATLLLGARRADRPIASCHGEVVTLQRFRADVAAAAAQLEAAGCRRGLVACDDAYWAMVGLFALAHGGAEALLPPNLLPATLTALGGAYDHMLTDGAVAPGDRILTLRRGDGGASTLPAMNAETAGVALFTSGSTGTPKRIAKTIRQLELEAGIVDRVLGQTIPAGAWIQATVTHQHLYGLTFRLCWPLATQRPFFGHAHQFWEPLLAAMDEGCVLVTTPSHLGRLGGLAPLPAGRRPSAVLSGGAPLSASAAEATRGALGCAPREFFGSTEAGVIASRLRDGDQEPAWRPMPGLAVSRREDGRLHVRSPYIADPEGETIGDLIDFDADGAFRLMGRTDRVAKIEGIRISLAEFDTRLAALPGVSEAAIVILGASTPYLGGVVVLDASGLAEQARAGAFRLGRRLRRDLAVHLPSAALPRRWRFVSKLPAGSLGKVNAAALAALFDRPEEALSNEERDASRRTGA
ncbi:AMP-binding protein [soil metagenome]